MTFGQPWRAMNCSARAVATEMESIVAKGMASTNLERQHWRGLGSISLLQPFWDQDSRPCWIQRAPGTYSASLCAHPGLRNTKLHHPCKPAFLLLEDRSRFYSSSFGKLRSSCEVPWEFSKIPSVRREWRRR